MVPFGVETDRFAPSTSSDLTGKIVIGTVKTLLPTYGIDVLLRGFAACRERLAASIGMWRKRVATQDCRRWPAAQNSSDWQALKIADVTEFAGPVSHDKVPEELNKLDVYVAMSRSESFGVAVIEASACERPVVVSDTGGLPEVVQHGETGWLSRAMSPLASQTLSAI